MQKIGLKNKLQTIYIKKNKMAVGVIAAAKVAKRLSKSGRAEAKEKKAGKLDKKAERKNKRAARLEKRAERKMGKGKMGKAAKLMGKAKKVEGKADIKTGKAIQKREKAKKLKQKIADGKTIKGRIKKGADAVSGAKDKIKSKVKEKGGVKNIVKNVAKKTPAGRIASGVKKAAGKVADAGAKIKRKTKAGVEAFKGTAMYDGPGGQETPKLGSMSSGMYNKAPGMYGKGSKISYGHNSGMKMSGYARAGLAGKGLSMNSQQKISKHMKKK